MKTAISIPDDEFHAAEKLAARLGISRSELYRNAIAEFLEKHRESGVTEKLNEVYEADDKASSLSEALHAMQGMSLAEERW
jgi:Ribbon-helix-helix protein, copG family.